jgi:hypothetical protein
VQPPVRLRWARWQQPTLVALVSEPGLVPYHWDHDRSRLCPVDLCPWCATGNRSIIRGYAAALVADCTDAGLQRSAWVRAVWELTAEQLLCWEAAAVPFGSVVVSRARDRNGTCKVRAPEWKPQPLPDVAAWPITGTIEAVFGAEGLAAWRRAQQ